MYEISINSQLIQWLSNIIYNIPPWEYIVFDSQTKTLPIINMDQPYHV